MAATWIVSLLLLAGMPAAGQRWDSLIAEAHSQHGKGDSTRAEELYRAALESARAEESSSLAVAATLNSLGSLLQETDRNEAAESAIREALALLEAMPEPPGPELARCLYNLGVTHAFQGRFAEAEVAHLRSLRVRSKDPAPDYMAIQTSLLALGNLYVSMVDFAKAEEHLSRALEAGEKAPGAGDASAVVYGELAELYRRRGDHHRAEAALRKGLALGASHESGGPMAVARLENQLALLLSDRGRFAEAEAAWRRSLALFEKHLGPGHGNVGIILINLGKVKESERRYAEAESLLRRALDILEKAYGDTHAWTARAMHQLGAAHAGQGHTQEAERLYLRSLAILEAAPSGADLEVATIEAGIGHLRRRQGRHKEALEWSGRALQRAEAMLGPEHPWLAEYLLDYAEALKKSGRKKEARIFESRAQGLELPGSRQSVDIKELSRGRQMPRLLQRRDALRRPIRVSPSLFSPCPRRLGRATRRPPG